MDAVEANNTKDSESREERFIRMGQTRMNKVLDSIRLLKNLSNRSSYAYTDEQVDKMFQTIDSAISDAKESFSGTKKVETDFKF